MLELALCGYSGINLVPGSIRILSYKDSSTWKLGKDVAYTFTGKFPTDALERQWSATLDQRFVARGVAEIQAGRHQFPVKQLALMKGTQGTLTFGENPAWFTIRRGCAHLAL